MKRYDLNNSQGDGFTEAVPRRATIAALEQVRKRMAKK